MFPAKLRRTLVMPRLRLRDLRSLLVVMLRMMMVTLMAMLMPAVPVPVLAAKSVPGDKTVTMESVPAVKEEPTTITTTMGEEGNAV